MKEMVCKRLIVVVGMHRCGTSTITRSLQAMAVDLGSRLMPPHATVNAKGFWEDIDLNALNIEILQFLESDWHHFKFLQEKDLEKLRSNGYQLRAVELLRKKLEKSDIFGFKDPRLAKLLPFWKDVFSYCNYDVSYVLALRHPISVCKSLEKRDGFEVEKSSLLWLVHVISSVIHTKNENRVFVDFDKFLAWPKKEVIRMAKHLDLQVDPAALEEFIASFLDEDLRHHTYQLSDFDVDDTLPVVRDVYTTLLKATAKNKLLNERIIEDKVSVWSDYLESQKFVLNFSDKLELKANEKGVLIDQQKLLIKKYESTVVEQEKRICEIANALNDINKINLSLIEKITEQEKQVCALELIVRDRDGSISLLNKVAAERDEIICALRQEVVDLDKLISAINQAAGEREEIKERLSTMLIEREEIIENMQKSIFKNENAIEALQCEKKLYVELIDELNDSLSLSREHIKHMSNSKSWRITRPLRTMKSFLYKKMI